MTRWGRLLVLGFAMLSVKVNAEQAWFGDTPMQQTYQALAADRPTVAWQELIFALSQEQIATQHWAGLKHAIINQTDCGQRLTEPNGKDIPQGLTISFVRRAGASSLGYEIKLSAEHVSRATLVTLTDPNGQTVISEILGAQTGFQELESGQLFTQVDPGVYELRLGGQHYSLVVYGLPRRPWVKLIGHPDQQLTVDLPNTPTSCAPAAAYWLWLDDAYRWIEQTPIYVTSSAENTPNPVKVSLPVKRPAKSEHLSAIVTHFEYQGAIKVNYVERLALPLPETPYTAESVNARRVK